jgi:hypothetical protein
VRRPVVLAIVIGAVVLGLVITVAVLFGVILPRFERGPESGPTYAPGELTPEESTVTAIPQPDGTVRVDQVLIFDIAPGLEDRPATWYLGGTQLGWKSSERAAQYGVIPDVVALSAREVPVTDAPVDLKITVDDSDYDDPFFDGRRYALIAPGPWSPGRHRVEFSYVLGAVWVQADGVRLLVLPLQFASGPGNGQPQDLVRLQVRGAGALQCPATNINFSERRSCGDGDRLVYRPDDLDQREAVTVTEPAGVTAPPVPVPEKTR